MALTRRTPKLGLALGSGSARGWSHIGVLRALRDAGIQPDVVCGSSIGALVGAAYAGGELERFADWVQGLGMRDVFGFMDFNLAGGMLKGEKLISFWRRNFADFDIENSPIPFGAVATDLHSGAEVWMRQGSIADAVRASIALPGLFTPVLREGRLLVDGGLVNPVPASLARAMGADIVIAVDLNVDLMQRHMQPLAVQEAPPPIPSPRHQQVEDGDEEGGDMLNRTPPDPVPPAGGTAGEEGGAAVPPPGKPWSRRLTSWIPGLGAPPAVANSPLVDGMRIPSVLDVVMTSVNIMQMRITRSRMAGDPPELVIAPRLAHLGLLDFHRAKEAMDAGYAATQAALPGLAHWLRQ
ncbi:patatin-like phospholipase family protein [Comamonas sp. CMM03]|uniref:patatin-like phospholipase family protein n=1 Tax=Comamonas sp. CMM03 TaxID=2854781 RepID=UPI001C477770|nr:patatin-like phospholipase family protein [Comamonas sp. CMM03]MBV7417808.1 patatin-like phospholipase family protein [Comamonas sp. CMM03]